jgi:hypothetical protein
MPRKVMVNLPQRDDWYLLCFVSGPEPIEALEADQRGLHVNAEQRRWLTLEHTVSLGTFPH